MVGRVILFCLFGFGAASLSSLPPGNLFGHLPSGSVQVFKYKGYMVNGMPELSKDYSGVAYECDVIFEIESMFRIKLRVENFKQGSIFNELDTPGTMSDYNWRTILVKKVQPVTGDFAQALSEGMVLNFLPNGEVSTASVSQSDSLSSVNFKKALAVLIQTKVRSTLSSDGASLPERMMRFNTHRAVSGFWTVQESSMEGICESRYQVNDVPDHIAKEYTKDSTLIPEESRDICTGPGRSMVEIIKTRNVNNCIKTNVYTSIRPGYVKCQNPGCLKEHSRTAVTRYIGCRDASQSSGSSAHLKLISIIHESEIINTMLGPKVEKIVSGVKQTLTLKSSSSGVGYSRSSSSSSADMRTRTLNSLLFEYSPSMQRSNSAGDMFADVDTTRFDITGNVINLIYDNRTLERKMKDVIVPQTKQMIMDFITKDLKNHEDMAKKLLPSKVLSLSKALGSMKKYTLMKIYEDLMQKVGKNDVETLKNVFFELLTMSGSTDSYLVLKEMIVKGRMNSVQLYSLFSLMPTSVLTPTERLVSEYFELISHPELKKRPFLQKFCLYSILRLVNSACLDKRRNLHYPTDIYGNFCNPDSSVVVGKVIPFLQTAIQNAQSEEQLNSAIFALGLIEHPSVLQMLLPVIEEKHKSVTTLSRVLAFGSLMGVAAKYPERVIPMIESIFHNQAEKSEIRLICLQILLRSEPSMVLMHKLALRTYNETNDEILKVLNVAFYSMKTNPTDFRKMKMAELLYPFIKKVEGVLQTSGLYYSGDYLKDLGYEYSSFTSWINSKDSIIPRVIMSGLVKKYGQFVNTEYLYFFRHTGRSRFFDIIKRTLQSISYESGHGEEGRSTLEEKMKKELSDEWRRVIEELKIIDREGYSPNEGMSSSIFVELFQTTPIYRQVRVKESSLRDTVRQILTDSNMMRKFLDFTMSTTIDRILNLSPTQLVIPSDMGVPFLIEANLPVVTCGHLAIKTENQSHSLIPKVKLNMTGFSNFQRLSTVRTVNYITEEELVIGVDEHVLLHVPASVELKYEPTNSELEITTKFSSTERKAKKLDLIHLHSRPFMEKVNSFMYKSPGNVFKVIKSNCPLVESTNNQMGDYLGLRVNMAAGTESCYPNWVGTLRLLKSMNYNPFNVVRFGFQSSALTEKMTPSVRKHYATIQLNLAESSTKGFIIKIKTGLSTKRLGEVIKYHKFVKENGEQTVMGKLWPYRISSKSLDETDGHQSRRDLLKEVMNKINVEHGWGFAVKVLITSFGTSRPIVWSQHMAISSGYVGFNNKWSLKLGSESIGKVFCATSKTSLSSMSLFSLSELSSGRSSSNHQFSHDGTVGWGSTCTEHEIITSGRGKRTDAQIESIRESSAAKRLEELRQKGNSKSLVELSESADELRKQLLASPKVEFKIKFKNINKYAIVYTDFVYNLMRTASFFNFDLNHNHPKLEKRLSERENGNVNGAIEYDLEFDMKRNTLAISMRGVEGVFVEKYPKVRVNYLQIPYTLTKVKLIPFHARNQDFLKSIVSAATGHPLYPTCKQEGSFVNTFDNVTGKVEVDECYHLLAADCSSDKSFGILIRSLGKNDRSLFEKTGSSKKLKVLVGKSVIDLTPIGGGSRMIGVSVDGDNHGSNTLSGSVALRSGKGKHLGIVTGATDGIMLTLDNGVSIKFDGEKTVVETPIASLKNKMCGLCGDNNNEKMADLKSPEKCLFTKSEVFSASYRIPSISIGSGKSCPSLRSGLEKDLAKGKEQCIKHGSERTKNLMTSFISSGSEGHSWGNIQGQPGKCTALMHEVYMRRTKMCFSKIPVRDCREGCRPGSSGTVKRSVAFACLPRKQKITEHIYSKVKSREIVHELRNLETSMNIELDLPKGPCV